MIFIDCYNEYYIPFFFFRIICAFYFLSFLNFLYMSNTINITVQTEFNVRMFFNRPCVYTFC